jgi:hypothetical protein
MAAATNEQQLAAFLASKGLGSAQIAGILANLKNESGFNPGSYNAGEGAIGIAQWEGGRRAALDQYAVATGGSETSLATQEGYLWQELTHSYASVLAAIRATSDPGTVAADWDVGPGGPQSGTGFENSSGSTTQQRIADARSIYAQLASGQLTGAGASSSGASGSSGAAGITATPANFPGGAWDPLNWPGEVAGAAGNAAGAAAGGVLKIVLPFMTKAAFLVGGLGLVIVGLYRSSQGVREAVKPIVEQAGAAAALAA